MEQKVKAALVSAFILACEPPFNGEIYEWAHQHVELNNNYAITGKFDVSISPYLIEPFRDLLRDRVEQINLVSARQTFKSGYSECTLAYIISNDPGPVLKVHQNQDVANTFTLGRLLPLLQGCKPVQSIFSLNKKAVRKDGIFLPHMSCKIVGPSENYLHGYTARYVLVDEPHLQDAYPPGTIEKLIGRTDAFKGKRRKIILTSTPGVVGDQLSKQMERGLIFVWAWQCPHCQKQQPWQWNKQRGEKKGPGDGITWDKVKNPDGTYNYDATGNTARLECCHCHKRIEDNEYDSNGQLVGEDRRKKLNDTGKFICIKADGDVKVHTYQWPAFVNTSHTFKEAVIQYLQAKTLFDNTRNDEDLKVFYQHVLGEEWKPFKSMFANRILVEPYNPNEAWPDEAYRIMGVDNQKRLGTKYYIIRAFDKKGNSRKIIGGKCHSWDDIHRIATEHKVKPHCVMVDCGFQETEAEVYTESVKHGVEMEFSDGKNTWKEIVGWTCLMGYGEKKTASFKGWEHSDKITRYYSEVHAKDAGAGIPAARMYLWSNYYIKNILSALRDGQGAVKWSTDTVDADYVNQLYSEYYDEVEGRWLEKNSNNHFWDVECMIIVGALMCGIPLQGV